MSGITVICEYFDIEWAEDSEGERIERFQITASDVPEDEIDDIWTDALTNYMNMNNTKIESCSGSTTRTDTGETEYLSTKIS